MNENQQVEYSQVLGLCDKYVENVDSIVHG